MSSSELLVRLADRLLAAAALAALAGCSGGEAPASMPDLGFAINGHPFVQTRQAAGMAFKTSGGQQVPEGWIVELYGQDLEGCTQFRSNGSYGTVLQFHLPLGANNGPVPVKSYNITLGNTSFVVNGDFHAAEPDTGTLDITAADGKHVAGTYDMTFRTKERLAGSFDAAVCN